MSTYLYRVLLFAPVLALVAGCGTGNTTVPAGGLAPASLDFGNVPLSTSSAAKSVVLSNTGILNLTISSIALSGSSNFAQTNNCPTTLGVGASCSINIVLTPTTTGTLSGSLSVMTPGTSNPVLQSSLTGIGVGPIAGTAFSGKVMANGLPVVGSAVQLYETGTAGNGSASAGLLSGAITTDAAGAFNIPASYTCSSGSGTLLFVIAKGGKVGASGSANSSLWLMAPVGACGSVTTSMTITINEVTTVASAWALAPFFQAGGSSAGNIGSSSTNSIGLTNAMISANVLTNMSTGSSPGNNPANVSVPNDKLDTLANALTPCAVASSGCSALFTAGTVSGSTAPTNTLEAAVNIVRHPAANVSAVYAAATGTAFMPKLVVAPPDWTMGITVSGGGMSNPTALAVDANGDIWSANYNGVLSEFSPGGAAVYTNGITGYGLNESYGMTIDANSNLWVGNNENGVNSNKGSISKFSSTGAPLSGPSGFTAGGINFPNGLAADTNGNIWIANYGNASFTLLRNDGTPATIACDPAGCGSGKMAFSVAVASDSNHNAWFANQADTTATFVPADGNIANVRRISCCDGASGIIVDAGNNVWVANYYGDSISLLSSTGSVLSSGYTGGGIEHPQGLAIDGGGNVWIANFRNNGFTELSGSASTAPGTALSPAIGFGTDANLLESYALVTDASGSVWVSNFGLNTLTQFVGLAVPVRTPSVGIPQIP